MHCQYIRIKKQSPDNQPETPFLKLLNYLTASLNFLPAEKAGTVFAAILIVAPV